MISNWSLDICNKSNIYPFHHLMAVPTHLPSRRPPPPARRPTLFGAEVALRVGRSWPRVETVRREIPGRGGAGTGRAQARVPARVLEMVP